jgi:hypothetical protein
MEEKYEIQVASFFKGTNKGQSNKETSGFGSIAGPKRLPEGIAAPAKK